MSNLVMKNYKHAPGHWFLNDSFYFFTGAVYQKKHLLTNNETKQIFIETLFQLVKKYNWKLYEWVVLENHYHFLVKINCAQDMSKFFNTLHKTTAFHIKKIQNIDIKPFWYQYWDTCIRDEKHYYETAMYIMFNPIKHNYVTNLNDYEFSSFHSNKQDNEDSLRKTFLTYKPQTINYYNEIDNF